MSLLSSTQQILRKVLHVEESSARTAGAFSLGVFIAFSPVYGFHTLLVFFCAWAFRLNLIAIMAGSFVNNPWTIVPVLGASMGTGLALLGNPMATPFVWQDLTMQGIYDQIRPYIWPFVLGGTILSAIGAAISYPLAHALITRYRTQQRQKEAASSLPPPEPSDTMRPKDPS